jgi:hypothetical protein
MILSEGFLKEFVHTHIDDKADLTNTRIVKASPGIHTMRFLAFGYGYEYVELNKFIYDSQRFYIGYGPINNVIVFRALEE